MKILDAKDFKKTIPKPPKQEQGLTDYLLEIEHKDNKSDEEEAFLIFHHIVELYDTKDFPFQVQLETSNFNDVFRYDLKHNNIMKANIPEHFIEITKQRGLIHEFDNFRDGDQLKLNTWLSKNREKAWKLIQSKEIAEKYFRLKGEQEQVYDI